MRFIHHLVALLPLTILGVVALPEPTAAVPVDEIDDGGINIKWISAA